MKKLLRSASAILILSCFCGAQAEKPAQVPLTGKVEEAVARPEGVSGAVGSVLESRGYRVLLDDGSLACTIWLRQAIPGQGSKEVPGSLYPQLGESTLLGVITFPQASTDYRGQAIAAGTYTLRYELQPDDGNHMGVSPTRDFLLLVPVASDTDPKAIYKFAELVALSRKASDTRHPAVLNLVDPGHSNAAAVTRDDEEHWIFSVGAKLDSGADQAIALVVKGTAPQ